MTEVEKWLAAWGDRTVIAFDFDGVIATYEGWLGADVFGKPIKQTIDFMNSLQFRSDYKFYVTIFTSRQATPAIKKWLADNNVHYDSINDNSHNPPDSSHKPFYHVFIDDRAIGYRGQHISDVSNEMHCIIKGIYGHK